METIYKYILIGLSIILIFISIRYYILSDDYDELRSTYNDLLSKSAVDKANITSLENFIKQQNILIEQYKTSSQEYSNKIDSLNKKIIELNKTETSYENSNNNNATSEEAITWLKEKASSLVY